MPRGLFLPVPDPHTWEFDVGLRTLTPVGMSLSVNQLVFSLWSFPPWRYGVVYIAESPLLPLDVASSLSSGVGYLFRSFQSIWLKVIQHLVVILLFV